MISVIIVLVVVVGAVLYFGKANNPVKKMVNVLFNVGNAKIAEATETIEKKNIISLSESSVKEMREQLKENIKELANQKISLDEFANSLENTKKKVISEQKEYQQKLDEAKNDNENTILMSRLVSLKRIIACHEKEIKTGGKQIEQLASMLEKFEASLQSKSAYIESMSRQLSTEKIRKTVNENAMKIAKSTNSILKDVDDVNYVEQLERMNNVSEEEMNIIDSIGFTNTEKEDDFLEQVKADLAK